MALDISENELRELVEQARDTLGIYFKNEALAKGESSDSVIGSGADDVKGSDSASEDDSESESDSSSSDSDSSDSSSSSGSDESGLDLGSGSESDSSESSDSGSSDEHSALEEGSVSLGDLKEAYAQLSDEELKLHYLASREVLHERMEQSGSGSSDESSLSDSSGSKSKSSSDLSSLEDGSTMKEEHSMAKKEESVSKAESVSRAESSVEKREGSGSVSAEVSKSRPAGEDVAKAEDRMANMEKDTGPRSKDRMAEMEHAKKSEDNAELEELKKYVDLQTQIIERLVAPKRKAVVSLAELTKSENEIDPSVLSKKDVMDHLAKLTRDPDLKKSDRNLINGYCFGKVSVKDLAHLFKK